ncbi:MAG TPA: hypothetical protein VL990_01250 [Acidobacteriaceae bacterium]|nr:hypothetical protein [Acidobacteriaceae bacterium]
MKTATFAVSGILLTMGTIAAVLPMTVRAAGGHDFDAVVSAVEHRYEAHAEKIPMMGLVSFCGWVATGGGVKGIRVAEFEHLTGAADMDELDTLVTGSLGGTWERMVTERERSGSLSLVYVQPDGQAMRMLIADYEHGELDVVRMEVNADRLQHWMRDPAGSARQHDYGTAKPD